MQISGESGRSLRVGEGAARLMGVVNVTPDSFYDGGRYRRADDAIEHGARLADEGADILDVGGESTRPGHETVSEAEQIERVTGVIAGLRRRVDVPISIDTTRAPVARAALDAGADWVNDTTALGADPDLGPLVAEAGCPVVLMHRFDPPRKAGDPAEGAAVVAQIAASLDAAAHRAQGYGIASERIVLDPGIGFGTIPTDNDAICAHLEPMRALGYPLLYGPSRKSFLGSITGKEAVDRLCATAAVVATLALGGVEILRVHDVAEMRDVVLVADALRRAGAELHGGNE